MKLQSLLVVAVVVLWSEVGLGQTALLSESGLYTDIVVKATKPDILSFSPQYPLWSDGAAKKRWIFLPPGTTLSSGALPEDPIPTDFDHWTFPVGTKLWKEFAFAGKRVETRLMEKTTPTKWEFSAYVWNEAETEATLAPTAGLKNHFPITADLAHDIPSKADCLSCHKRGGDPVLGFDALQLSGAQETGMLTFGALKEKGLLSYVPDRFLTEDPKIHAATEAGRNALGYLSANCGSCHNPDGRAAFTELYFRHHTSATQPTEEVTFVSAINRIANGFLIPGVNPTYQIRPGLPEQSAVWYRMTQTGPARMPSIGTKILDDKAVEMLKAWIQELAP